MLNLFDDYPIHQTPEPIAHPATSDRNVYDRTWFNGFTPDGTAYFGIGIAVYPHRRVLDCAFSVVTAGGAQHSFFASRLAPAERTEMQVGPFRLEVLEPMRRARVVLDDNPTGIACDLTFMAATSPLEEARQVLWEGPRKVMDATRFAQFGAWSGSLTTPDGTTPVVDWCGIKDRSWGIRAVGEPDPPGAPRSGNPGIFFLWAPLFWDDHVTHALWFDDVTGRHLVSDAFTAPLGDGRPVRAARAEHRVRYTPGTRLAASAEIDLHDADGVRTIAFEPLLRFHMKGLGYLHPTWAHGGWQGELAIHGESFDPAAIDLLARENIHVQQVCRVSDGTRTGIGVLEQVVLGPYFPAGLQGATDGA